MVIGNLKTFFAHYLLNLHSRIRRKQIIFLFSGCWRFGFWRWQRWRLRYSHEDSREESKERCSGRGEQSLPFVFPSIFVQEKDWIHVEIDLSFQFSNRSEKREIVRVISWQVLSNGMQSRKRLIFDLSDWWSHALRSETPHATEKSVQRWGGRRGKSCEEKKTGLGDGRLMPFALPLLIFI